MCVYKENCIDCGDEFEFTEGEQTYYREHNLTPPKRCNFCRRLKKMRNADIEREASKQAVE